MTRLASGSDSADLASPAGPRPDPSPAPLRDAEPPMRVCDADRDRVLAELRQRYAEGRLSSDTFMARLDATLAAKYSAELAAQLVDLPRPRRPAEVLLRPGRRLAGRVRLLRANASARRSRKIHLAAETPELVLPSSSQLRFSIGRDLTCDFTVADISVSRLHAALSRDGDGWLLSDLNSTNGTRLNGWRVNTPAPVRPGDRVSFGGVGYVVADRPIGPG